MHVPNVCKKQCNSKFLQINAAANSKEKLQIVIL